MEIRDKILKITGLFGMPAKIASKAMQINYQTYYNKLNERENRHTFNQKNLDDLKSYIKEKSKEVENF